MPTRPRMFATTPLVAVLLLLGFPANAASDVPLATSVYEPATPALWGLHAEARTDAPVTLGGRLVLRGPGGLQVASGAGVVPDAYVSGTTSLAQTLGGSSDEVADLIHGTLGSAWAWRTTVGWMPQIDRGPYVEMGYGLMRTDGELSLANVLAVVEADPRLLDGVAERYGARSSLHQLGLEVGWRWRGGTAWTVALAVGFWTTTSASSEVTDRGPNTRPAFTQTISGEAERILADALEEYVHLPTVSLAVGHDLM